MRRHAGVLVLFNHTASKRLHDHGVCGRSDDRAVLRGEREDGYGLVRRWVNDCTILAEVVGEVRGGFGGGDVGHAEGEAADADALDLPQKVLPFVGGGADGAEEVVSREADVLEGSDGVVEGPAAGALGEESRGYAWVHVCAGG